MGLSGSFALPVGRGSCRAVTLPFNPCSTCPPIGRRVRGSEFRIGRRGLTKRSGLGNNGRGPERRLGAPGRNGVFRAEVPVFLNRGANASGVRVRQLNLWRVNEFWSSKTKARSPT